MYFNKRTFVEFLGTFWLVFAGCGSAVIAAAFPGLGIGFVGVALAFGLSVVTMAYAFGNISGGHFNPAITIGLASAGKFSREWAPAYAVAQVAGAVTASCALYVIASGSPAFDLSRGFAANGYGAHSPGGYSMAAAFLAEFLLTFLFVMIALGASGVFAPKGFAPLAIGLALTLIHLVSIPITNTSVNPARSLGPALFAGGWAMAQLWLFWVAPLLGAVCAGVTYRKLALDVATGFPKAVSSEPSHQRVPSGTRLA